MGCIRGELARRQLGDHAIDNPSFRVTRGRWRVLRVGISGGGIRPAAVLPTAPAGVRTAGDPDRMISRVAVSGGAGDAHLADAASSGADAYVTADLRHHYATEHLSAGGPALVDPGHWASEWPWLPVAARALADAVAAEGGGGATVRVLVSEQVTDPWTLHD